MNGFMEAFADAHLHASGTALERVNDHSLASQRHGLLLRAQRLLKGCEVHWERSVKHIGANAHYVPAGHEHAFRRLCDEMKRAVTRSIFWQLEEGVRSTYPETSNWLDWWIRSDLRPMIFDAFRAMEPEVNKKLPDSTNPVESIHHSITVSTGKKHPLLAGLLALRLYEQRLQRQYTAAQGLNDALHII